MGLQVPYHDKSLLCIINGNHFLNCYTGVLVEGNSGQVTLVGNEMVGTYGGAIQVASPAALTINDNIVCLPASYLFLASILSPCPFVPSFSLIFVWF